MERARCKVCGAPLDPLTGYRCRYCGDWFCVHHHLPELHDCPGLKRGPGEEGYWFKPSEVEVRVETARPLKLVKARPPLSAVEFKDLAASTLVLALAFTILWDRFYLFTNPAVLVLDFPAMLLAVVTAFVFHELAHRSVARAKGYWAEYRAWPPGLLLALASSFLGIIFAAPGAVYVEGMLSRRDYGLISLAGPLINVALALTLKATLPALMASPAYLTLLWNIAQVNAWLGLFNLLPFPPLDGYKVATWSLPAWGAAIALAIVALLL